MFNIVNLIFFVLFVILGFLNSMKTLRRLRARRRYKDILFEWAERPYIGIDDLYTWMGIAIHWLSVTIMGLLVFLMIAFFPYAEKSFLWWLSTVQSFLAVGILGASMSVIGFFWGSAIFMPIANIFGENRHYAVTGDGMLFAGSLFTWNTFSHFSFDAEKGIILIWSVSLPKVFFALKPASLDTTSKILEILQAHLPVSNRKPVTRYIFPIFMTCICIPAVIFVILTFWLPIIAALVIDAFLIYIIMYIMGRLSGNPPLAKLDEHSL